MELFTVGHGNRSLAELLGVLQEHGVATLLDVRAWPRSKRWPHFDRDALEAAIPDAGIAYRWLGKALGGRRPAARADSPHVALEEEWRGYADHMETKEFAAGIDVLLGLDADAAALMCAEKDWRSCHRRMLADHLVAVAGVSSVIHIGAGEPRAHALDPRARVVGERLVYDRGAQTRLFE